MLPVPAFLAARAVPQAPSLFHWRYSDRLFALCAWAGVGLRRPARGLADRVPLWAAMAVWLVLWVLYLSIVNVGQTWYCVRLGVAAARGGVPGDLPRQRPTRRRRCWCCGCCAGCCSGVEFGAGLIKMRGDRCWRDLTCLYYHHETQPMPGPLSWFFHHLPRPLHRVEVAANHVTQLVVPFGLFAPQPVAGVAAAIMVVTQLWLVRSGNFAWLNWLTIVLACSAIDDGRWPRCCRSLRAGAARAAPPRGSSAW